MSFERMPGPAAGEPAPPGGDASSGGSPIALRLQVLATEHWGLLATRSLAWNESFTRAGMFLSALSGAIVALALVAQATSFGGEFVLFALVILPVVMFLGITTYVRIGRSNAYDAMCVVGMNRIRHAYLQIAPEVEPYLVMGAYDDQPSIDASMGYPPGRQSWLVDVLISTPFVLAVINSVIGGVIGAVIGLQLGAGNALAVGVATLAAIGAMAGQTLVGMRAIGAEVARYEPKFPSPAAAPASAAADERAEHEDERHRPD